MIEKWGWGWEDEKNGIAEMTLAALQIPSQEWPLSGVVSL